VAYIAMELLRGEQLSYRIMRSGRMGLADALRVLIQLAEALEAAHAHGVVHRDLKPDNIILALDNHAPGRERVKILDFGVAKLSGGLTMGSAAQAGVMMGTPKYMAPEQFLDAEAVDHRADIYSLGCIAYEMLTGEPLFSGNTPELSVRHQTEPVATLSSQGLIIPPALEALIGQMLAKDPASRPATMGDILQDLQRISDPRKIITSPEEDISLDVLPFADVSTEDQGICDAYATPAPANDSMTGRGRGAGAGSTVASIFKKLLWPLLLLLASAAEGSLIALLFLNQSIDRQDHRGHHGETPLYMSPLSPGGTPPMVSMRPGGDGHLLQPNSAQSWSPLDGLGQR
jgi:serine/threonine protein kinase